MAHSQHGHDAVEGNHDSHGSIFDRIIKPFLILTAITALEFLIAFTMDANLGRVIIFIVLTLAKAFFIMAYFMHVKFEKIGMIYSVTLPFLFVLYLIALLLMEGGYMFSQQGY